jgi:hypothetical protein
LPPERVVDLAYHAEVDEPDPGVRLYEQVAGVRVGVEKAVFEDHAHRHAGGLGR